MVCDTLSLTNIQPKFFPLFLARGTSLIHNNIIFCTVLWWTFSLIDFLFHNASLGNFTTQREREGVGHARSIEKLLFEAFWDDLFLAVDFFGCVLWFEPFVEFDASVAGKSQYGIRQSYSERIFLVFCQKFHESTISSLQSDYTSISSTDDEWRSHFLLPSVQMRRDHDSGVCKNCQSTTSPLSKTCPGRKVL